MREKKEKHEDECGYECECGKPENHKLFKKRFCSDEQIIKCHGQEYLNQLTSKENR